MKFKEHLTEAKKTQITYKEAVEIMAERSAQHQLKGGGNKFPKGRGGLPALGFEIIAQLFGMGTEVVRSDIQRKMNTILKDSK